MIEIDLQREMAGGIEADVAGAGAIAANVVELFQRAVFGVDLVGDGAALAGVAGGIEMAVIGGDGEEGWPICGENEFGRRQHAGVGIKMGQRYPDARRGALRAEVDEIIGGESASGQDLQKSGKAKDQKGQSKHVLPRGRSS